MLINFKFKNFRSFYDETDLSLSATADTDLKEINTFSVDNGLPKSDNTLLKSVVLFGSNATGKSNVLKGLEFMREVLTYSASQMPIAKNNEPFAFYENSENESSLYEVEIIQNDAYYRYGFTIKNGEIEEEWLDRRAKRISEVFRRSKQIIKINGEDAKYERIINVSNTALFLSVGGNFNLSIGKYLNDVMSWFKNLFIVFDNRGNYFDIYTEENNKYLMQALKILQLADIGINSLEVTKNKIDDENVKKISPTRVKIRALRGQLIKENQDFFDMDLKTTFSVFNKANTKTSEKDVYLLKDSGFNSEGTVRLLCYLGFILKALDKGLTIFIDEIDSKLHFLVVDYILKLFNSIDKNPNNAQLVCTAHNVLLMDENLRRDQIYFTAKDKFGKSKLTSLSDYTNVRKSDLFSKKYLAGFYTKLPDMN